MRYGTDHHAFVLFNKKVMDRRADRKFGAEVTVNQITWQCGSLKEILDAHTYFEKRKIPIQRVDPGIDYSAFALDPDGHCIQLYYYMEQVGWDGRARTPAERRRVESPWPATLEPLSDTYVDQVFQGPLG
jgi:hypothetical protein